MNRFQQKVMLKVGAMHLLIIGVMLVIPLLKGCFTPKKPEKLITFIELGAPPPSVSIDAVENLAPIEEPAQEAVPEEVEPPPPELIPEPIKEPVKKKLPPPKKKLESPKKVTPKPKDPVKKWKPVDPSKIKIGPKVESKTPPSTVDTSDLKDDLKTWTKSGGSTAGVANEFSAFYLQVRNTLYGYWNRPTSAAPGSCTIVRISILKNGQITKRAKIAGSGDLVYDRTVMDAVNAVSMLPKPPANYPYDYIEVEFVLE